MHSKEFPKGTNWKKDQRGGENFSQTQSTVTRSIIFHMRLQEQSYSCRSFSLLLSQTLLRRVKIAGTSVLFSPTLPVLHTMKMTPSNWLPKLQLYLLSGSFCSDVLHCTVLTSPMNVIRLSQ